MCNYCLGVFTYRALEYSVLEDDADADDDPILDAGNYLLMNHIMHCIQISIHNVYYRGYPL